MTTPILSNNCYRCRRRPGVVDDGVAPKCVECAGEVMRDIRGMLKEIDAVVTKGLPLIPKIANRVEFIRECVRMQREIGAGTLIPGRGDG